MLKTLLLVCSALLLLPFAPATAAPIPPGVYKGVVTVGEEFVDAGLTLKKSMPLRGRIRENGSFLLISPVFGPSQYKMSGRIFTGSIQLGTAVVSSISGVDVDGTNSGSAINLPGSYNGKQLKFSFSLSEDAVAYGERKITRTFTLRRAGS